MDLKAKCEAVMRERGWTNEDLANAIGMTPSNLSSAKAGRRAMPAASLIRLERLRGTDDHSIIEQLLKTAACVALAVIVSFTTPSPAEAAPALKMPNMHFALC